jgi:hypothetical protein
MMKRACSLLLLVLMLSACQFGSNANMTADVPDPLAMPWEDRAIFQPGLSASQQHVLADLPGAPIYHIDLIIAENLTQVEGRQQVRYTNQEDVTLEQVDFHLYPNILGGKLDVNAVSVDGVGVAPSFDLQNSVLIVPLHSPLKPGEHTIIQIDFSVTVPTDLERNYGVLAYSDGVLALAHFYPAVAVFDQRGWAVEIPSEQGDVTYADASLFAVRVTAPTGVVVVASGQEIQADKAGKQQVILYAIGPARDFYLAASPDYEVVSKNVDGVMINSYAPAKMKAGAQYVLDIAAKALKVYGERYAPYPYSEFDIVSTPTLALGIEYPGMTAIADRLYDLNGAISGTPVRIYLESTVAHEVGHQWFYNLVGSDQLGEPWLDESLTQFVTLQYYSDSYGTSAAAGFEQSLYERWARVDDAKIPIGLPVSAYQGKEYGAIVYGRGGLFFEALEKQMGESAFDKFLLDYVQTYSWRIATGDGMEKLAKDDCGCDLVMLWDGWVLPKANQ